MSDETALIETWLKIMAGILFVILLAMRGIEKINNDEGS